MLSPITGDHSPAKNLLSHRSIRRRLAAIALSAIVSGGLSLGMTRSAPADSPAAVQPQASSADLLQQGINQYNAGQFEESVVSLEQVDPKSLSDKGRAAYQDTLNKANAAANERVDARKEFELGEQSLAAHDSAGAVKHYQAVVDNRFADEGTRQKAIEQLALAKAQAGAVAPATPAVKPVPVVSAPAVVPSGDSNWATYQQATDDMNAGRYDAARSKFKQLDAAGYKPAGFHRTPAEMLTEVDFRAGQSAAPKTADDAFADAKYQYDHGNLVGAKLGFQQAIKMGYAGSANEPSPADYLAKINKAEGTTAVADAPASTPIVASVPVAKPAPVDSGGAVEAMADIGGPSTQPAESPDQKLKDEAAEAALQKERDQFRARGLVDLARQAYAENNKVEALNDYTIAAQLDPTNDQAAQGKKQLEEELGKAPTEGGLGNFASKVQEEVQEIEYRFKTAIDGANAAVAAGDFAGARQKLDEARVARSLDPGIFPVEQLNAMDTTISQTETNIANAEKIAEATKEKETEVEIQEQRAAAAAKEREDRERQVSELIHQSREYIDEYNWSAALGVLDQILVLDPRNDYAVGMRQFVEDKAIVQDQRKFRSQFESNYMKLLNRAEEEQIPYDDILRYPDNWPDISAARDEEVKEERDVSREDQTVQAQLDKVLPVTLKFDNVAFSEAINFLRDVTGANIFVNTRALDAAGIDPTTAITLPPLRNVKFSKALSTILSMVGGNTKLAYEVDEGVITISTADALNQNTVIRVYDVRDLLIQPPNINVSTANSNFLNSGGGGGQTITPGQGGGSGTNLNFGSSLSGGNQGTGTQLTPQELTDDLIKLVEGNVAPDTWRDQGGTIGSITDLQGNGELVITQTPENHQKVQDLLDKLREQRALMVTVECRFLEVDKHFIEDVGLDLNGAFNINRSPNSPWSPVLVSNIANTGLTNLVSTGVPQSLAGSAQGLNLTATYLDDFQVNLVLTAVEASTENTLVTAPRVTLFDNGTATIGVNRNQYYVSGLTPIVAAGVVGFTPIIGVTTSGVTLNVQATISADRKYVTLDMFPQLTSLIALVPFSFTTPGSNTTATGGIGGTVVSSAVQETIQEPIEEVTSVRTLVSVPDGGTLLLGGLTIAGEAEAEQGLPVLSKVPFLKRLFTNHSMAKDDNILLILVKPTIVIQHEIEEKNFPILSSKTAAD